MTRRCEWCPASEACAEDLGDLRKVSELSFCRPKKKVDFRLLAKVLRRVLHVVGGGRWKSQHRKIVYLSPHVEKPFKSKVIKSFVPELRSRKCFVFLDSLCPFNTSVYYGYVIFTLHILPLNFFIQPHIFVWNFRTLIGSLNNSLLANIFWPSFIQIYTLYFESNTNINTLQLVFKQIRWIYRSSLTRYGLPQQRSIEST